MRCWNTACTSSKATHGPGQRLYLVIKLPDLVFTLFRSGVEGGLLILNEQHALHHLNVDRPLHGLCPTVAATRACSGGGRARERAGIRAIAGVPESSTSLGARQLTLIYSICCQHTRAHGVGQLHLLPTLKGARDGVKGWRVAIRHVHYRTCTNIERDPLAVSAAAAVRPTQQRGGTRLRRGSTACKRCAPPCTSSSTAGGASDPQGTGGSARALSRLAPTRRIPTLHHRAGDKPQTSAGEEAYNQLKYSVEHEVTVYRRRHMRTEDGVQDAKHA
jgi:hypothetical protein